jgi:thioredoxin-like negative regulator of GroEL
MLHQMNDSNYMNYVNGNKAFYCLFYSNNLPNIPNVIKVFEEFDEQFKGKIDVCICEIDAQKYMTDFFQMNTLPAVVFMKQGQVYGNIAGPASKAKYQEIAKEAIMTLMKQNNG